MPSQIYIESFFQIWQWENVQNQGEMFGEKEGGGGGEFGVGGDYWKKKNQPLICHPKPNLHTKFYLGNCSNPGGKG